MKLTSQQRDTLALVKRSLDLGDGWRGVTPVLFEKLINPMPPELIERDEASFRVRLTSQGETLVEWAC